MSKKRKVTIPVDLRLPIAVHRKVAMISAISGVKIDDVIAVMLAIACEAALDRNAEQKS